MVEGADERSELFRLLPRILRALPESPSRAAVALSSLYPSLHAAAQRDARLSVLEPLAPVLAHVIAASLVSDNQDSARAAARVLVRALCARGKENGLRFAQAAFHDIADAIVLLSLAPDEDSTKQDERVGQVDILSKLAAEYTNNEGSTMKQDMEAWPTRRIRIQCTAQSRQGLRELLIELMSDSAWVRLGAAGRDSVLQTVCRACDGEFGNKLLQLNAAVPLSRPQRIRIQAMLDSAVLSATERLDTGKRDSVLLDGEPPSKRQRTNRYTESTAEPAATLWRQQHNTRADDRTAGPDEGHQDWTALAIADENLLKVENALLLQSECRGIRQGLLDSTLGVETASRRLDTLRARLHDLLDDEVNESKPAPRAALLEAFDADPRRAAVFVDIAAYALETAVLVDRETAASAAVIADNNGTQAWDEVSLSTTHGPKRTKSGTSIPDYPRSTVVLSEWAPVVRGILSCCFESFLSQTSKELHDSSISTWICRASMLLIRLSSLTSGVLSTEPRDLFSGAVAEDQEQESSTTAPQHRETQASASANRAGLARERLISLALGIPCALTPHAASCVLLAVSSDLSSREVSQDVIRALALKIVNSIQDRDTLQPIDAVVEAGCLKALSNIVCSASACCTCRSVLAERYPERIPAVAAAEHSDLWESCFQLCQHYICSSAGEDDTVGSATRLLGRLLIHVPLEHRDTASALLVQALGHPTSKIAREEAADAVHIMFNTENGSGSGSSSAGLQSLGLSTNSPTSGRERSPHPGSRADFSQRRYDIAKHIGSKLANENQPDAQSGLDLAALARVAVLSGALDDSASSVAAMAMRDLLVAAAKEQVLWRFEEGNGGAGQSSRPPSASPLAPTGQSWFELFCLAFACEGHWPGLLGLHAETNAGGWVDLFLGDIDGSYLYVQRSGAGGTRTIDSSPVTLQEGPGDFLARFLVSRYRTWIPHCVGTLLSDKNFEEQMVSLVGEKSATHFWNKIQRIAVSAVIEQANALRLESLSVRLGQSSAKLVRDVAPEVMAEAICKNPACLLDKPDESIELIQQAMDSHKSDIVVWSRAKIVQRVMLHSRCNNDQSVRSALGVIGTAAATTTASKESLDPSNFVLAEVLEPHFLLVMDAINRRLFAPWTTRMEQRHSLFAMRNLIDICCTSLHLYVPKVVATLKMAVELPSCDRQFRSATCELWAHFIRNLGPDRVGPHMGSCLAILAPVLSVHHRTLAPALCEVFTACASLKGSEKYSADVSLLVTTIAHPSLEPIGRAFESAHGDSDDSDGQGLNQDGPAMLPKLFHAATTHDSAVIRALALGKVLTTLRTSRAWLLSVISMSETGPQAAQNREFVARLAVGLTRMLSYPSDACRRKCLQCLGELGGIDPSRIAIFLSQPDSGIDLGSRQARHGGGNDCSTGKSHDLHDMPKCRYELAAKLLSDYLVPALLLGDREGGGNRLNRLGFAVQELLQVCGCNPNTLTLAKSPSAMIKKELEQITSWDELSEARNPAAKGVWFWMALQPSVQEAVEPYLSRPFDTGTYNSANGTAEADDEDLFAAKAEQALLARGSIWTRLRAAAAAGSGSASTAEWRMQVCVALVEFIGLRGEFGPLFRALRPALRHEGSLCAFVLPLLLMEAIDCTRTLLDPCTSERGRRRTTSDSRSLVDADDIIGRLVDSAVVRFAVGELTGALEEGGEAAQVVFSTHDTLRAWRDLRALKSGRALFEVRRGGSSAQSARTKGSESASRMVALCRASDSLSILCDLEGKTVIPLLQFAEASYRSRAYSRAILYAEEGIRNLRKAGGISHWPAYVKSLTSGSGYGVARSAEADNRRERRESLAAKFAEYFSRWTEEEDKFLRLIEKCLTEVEDADALHGVSALSRRALQMESSTNAVSFTDADQALPSYERAVSSSPDDPVLNRRLLQCLRTVGHWETMLAHSDMLLTGRRHSVTRTDDHAGAGAPSLPDTARAFGIEAAWRLGRWDRVRDLCSQTNDQSGLWLQAGEGQEHEREKRLRIVDASQPRTPALAERDWESQYALMHGQMLLAARDANSNDAAALAELARGSIMGPAVHSAIEGYARAYPLIVRLHTVADIEEVGRAQSGLANGAVGVESGQYLVQSDTRAQATAASLNVREPIMSGRRVCLELLGRTEEAARVGLELAALARKSGNYRAAASAANHALSSVPHGSDEWFAATTEVARIQAERGDKTSALRFLGKTIDLMSQALEEMEGNLRDVDDGGRPEDTDTEGHEHAIVVAKRRLSEAHVLAGRWIEQDRSAPSAVINSHLVRARNLTPESEEPLFALGRFHDKLLLASIAEGGRMSMDMRSAAMVVISLFAALRNGHGLLNDVLPRVFTVWFDFYSTYIVLDNGGQVSPAIAQAEKKVGNAFRRAVVELPTYMWMTVVPQLLSRLLHPSEVVRDGLKMVLTRVVASFPEAALWLIGPSSLLKKCPKRKKIATEIINATCSSSNVKMALSLKSTSEAKVFAAAAKNMFKNGLGILRHLVDVCETQPPRNVRGRTMDCTKEFARMRADIAKFPHVPVPRLSALTVVLPSELHELGGNRRNHTAASSDITSMASTGERHSPFASSPVSIVDIDTSALVMSSAMRPRRVSLLGSDGVRYRFLAKKENAGDMRKDSRLMELLTVVNRLLAKDSDAQSRQLSLRTYAVIPLNEEAGLIEWVDNISTLRMLVAQQHATLGISPDHATIKRRHDEMEKLAFLEDWAIPSFPAVLDRFFISTFGSTGNPQAWLAARTKWIRSVAAWSMTGYIVGLGDRHCENILVETTTGMCVHVDFAVLFDKGRSLKVPEIVPFRLTQNMVVAMGIAGYEGTFRKTCEIVLRLLRANDAAIMGVLESFLHDPLADWAARSGLEGGGGGAMTGRGGAGGGRVAAVYGGERLAAYDASVDAGDEGSNPHATEMRQVVEAKLKGVVEAAGSSLPLSVAGQVERLVHDATSNEMLAQMFIWWSSWT